MSKAFKRVIIRLAFGVEILVFALFFVKSIDSINKMRLVNLTLSKEVNNLKFVVDEIKQKVDEWNSDTFYKEQIAREKLQMANSKDEIYYI